MLSPENTSDVPKADTVPIAIEPAIWPHVLHGCWTVQDMHSHRLKHPMGFPPAGSAGCGICSATTGAAVPHHPHPAHPALANIWMHCNQVLETKAGEPQIRSNLLMREE